MNIYTKCIKYYLLFKVYMNSQDQLEYLTLLQASNIIILN